MIQDENRRIPMTQVLANEEAIKHFEEYCYNAYHSSYYFIRYWENIERYCKEIGYVCRQSNKYEWIEDTNIIEQGFKNQWIKKVANDIAKQDFLYY